MPSVAIVTGGTGSLGGAISSEFLRRGLVVVAADRDEPSAQSDGIHFLRTDVTSADSLDELFARASAFGQIKIVVAAHGILALTPIGQASAAELSRILETNLTAVAALCNIAAQKVVDGGSILLFSSIAASLGRLHFSVAYQMSKAGVEALTRACAVALAPRQIRVNCLAPGFVAVPMKGTAAMREDRGGDAYRLSMTPLGRFVTPTEVANAAAFLCSAEASGITGVTLPVDGGALAL
jgi:NAD(P)-dependent dehydrogenase (short-subunit alcohol dehydrogenase family)